MYNRDRAYKRLVELQHFKIARSLCSQRLILRFQTIQRVSLWSTSCSEIYSEIIGVFVYSLNQKDSQRFNNLNSYNCFSSINVQGPQLIAGQGNIIIVTTNANYKFPGTISDKKVVPKMIFKFLWVLPQSVSV